MKTILTLLALLATLSVQAAAPVTVTTTETNYTTVVLVVTTIRTVDHTTQDLVINGDPVTITHDKIKSSTSVTNTIDKVDLTNPRIVAALGPARTPQVQKAIITANNAAVNRKRR